MVSQQARRTPNRAPAVRAASVLEHAVDGHPVAGADRRGSSRLIGSSRLMVTAQIGNFDLTLRIQLGTNFTDGLAW